MKVTLTISVESVEFDKEQCALRINGRNIEENEHVKRGQYHTIEIELSQPFWIMKDCWDHVFLDRSHLFYSSALILYSYGLSLNL